MFSCFTVKNKNEKKLQESPNASPTKSLLDSQIDAMRHLSLLWSMGSQIPEEGTNNLDHTVVAAAPTHGSPSHSQSNKHHSPQPSSFRPDKLAAVSTKTWDEQSIQDRDYVNVPPTPGNGQLLHLKWNRSHSPQKSSVTRPDKLAVVSPKVQANQTTDTFDYVVMQGGPKCTTPSDGCPLHPQSKNTESFQESSVARPKEKLATVSPKTQAHQTLEEFDYVLMQGKTKCITLGDDCPLLYSKSNGFHSDPKASELKLDKLLDKIIADAEKWSEEFSSGSSSLQETHSVSKHQSPLLLLAAKIQSSQKPNTTTEIDKKINHTIQAINNNEELQQVLRQRKKITDANDQVQKSVSEHRSTVPSSPGKSRPLQKPNMATRIDKKINQKIPTIWEISNEKELMQVLQQRKKITDANNQVQTTAKSLPQQMSAMDTNRLFIAGTFNIKAYPGSRTKLDITVAGNRNN